jgi:fructose/tagatose bisphosphate aldolase
MQAMTLDNPRALVVGLQGVARIAGERLEVSDPARLRDDLIDEIVFEAVFHPDEGMREACRWVIWSASQALGCGSSSIHDLYLARGRGEVDANAFTVPAINIRASTYLTARQAFAAAIERDAGAVVFEIAKSEMAYTDQRPGEYAAVILAAALREGWLGPVFLQGDHFQFNATRWRDDPDAEMAGLKSLTREAIAAAFLNIDIDSSTLVDLSQLPVSAQQAVNASNTVELSLLIRELQPDGVVIGVGGEIGEVGKVNSTEEELRAYLDGYFSTLHGSGIPGLSKVSIQTGTSHGGVPMPDGSVAEVKIDFDTLRRLSTVARDEYGLAGCVQHGASTLPDEAFHHFPANGTAEIHLATGFQNILYDEPGMPAELRAEMMAWAVANCADERKDGESESQFLYKTRKKAIGPFKREVWTLPADAQAQIGANLRSRFGILFDELQIAGTRGVVDRYVTQPDLPRPLPAALGGAVRQVVTASASVFEDDGSGE